MSNKQIQVKDNFCGFLEGHSGMVTSIVAGHSTVDGRDNNILVSGSRDKTLIVWKLNADTDKLDNEFFGEPFLALTGHNHFISDLSLSNDNNFLLSSSWDKSLRLWNLKNGTSIERFAAPNQKEIMSVTFSADNRQIFSGGCDNSLSLWNIKGKHMMSSGVSNHNDWVSRVRYSPSAKNKFYASVGWDGKLKLWTDFFKPFTTVKAHEGPINALAISTTGQFVATGGRDNLVKIWKVTNENITEPEFEFKVEGTVTDIAFNPEFRWMAVTTSDYLRVYDLANQSKDPLMTIKAKPRKTKIDGKPKFTSLAWSSSGKFLYAGCSDGLIRVHNIDISES